MNLILKITTWIVGIIIGLLIIGKLGMTVKPANFCTDDLSVRKPEFLPVSPETGSKLMNNYLKKVCPDSAINAKSAVIYGRSKINVNGLWMPLRHIGYYRPAVGFYRKMEVCWFGFPFIDGEDYYMNGNGSFRIGNDTISGPGTNQGFNLSIWAEALWTPWVFLKNKDISFRDSSNTVICSIPFDGNTDEFTYVFDEDTGLITQVKALRCKGDTGKKVHWQIDVLKRDIVNGYLIPVESSIKWANEKKPWAIWIIEGLIPDVEIEEYIPVK